MSFYRLRMDRVLFADISSKVIIIVSDRLESSEFSMIGYSPKQ